MDKYETRPLKALMEPSDPLLDIGICLLLGVALSSATALGQYLAEYITFHAFQWLEHKRLIRRFAPSVLYEVTSYSWENFWAVAGSHIPVITILAFFRQGLIERAAPSLGPWAIWKFVWTTMILHDCWFFFTHSVMHWSKFLYKHLHQMHHSMTADLNTFATSYAEALEFLIDWAAFYGLLVTYHYNQPTWNPIALLCTLFPVALVNVMGHSGYALPLWIYAPLSFGVLLTPGAQESKIHYIHHLDPRYNRSLYFTWWDRMAGTYRDNHPLLDREALKLKKMNGLAKPTPSTKISLLGAEE